MTMSSLFKALPARLKRSDIWCATDSPPEPVQTSHGVEGQGRIRLQFYSMYWVIQTSSHYDDLALIFLESARPSHGSIELETTETCQFTCCKHPLVTLCTVVI